MTIVLPPHESSDLTKRVGRINVSREFLMGHPLIVMQAFALLEFVPYEIVNYQPNVLTYWGMNPRFDHVEPSTIPPSYSLEIEEQDRTVVNVNVKRESTDGV